MGMHVIGGCWDQYLWSNFSHLIIIEQYLVSYN